MAVCLSVTTNSFTEENKDRLLIVLVRIPRGRRFGYSVHPAQVMVVSEALVHNALSLSVDMY